MTNQVDVDVKLLTQLRKRVKYWRWERFLLLLFCSIFIICSLSLSSEDSTKLLRTMVPSAAWGMICYVLANWRGKPTTVLLLEMIEAKLAEEKAQRTN